MVIFGVKLAGQPGAGWDAARRSSLLQSFIKKIHILNLSAKKIKKLGLIHDGHQKSQIFHFPSENCRILQYSYKVVKIVDMNSADMDTHL